MKHGSFQRAGNRNMTFPAIIAYPYFEKVRGNFYLYRRPQGTALDGLKVWPDRSPLSGLAAKAWDSLQREPRRLEGQ